VNLASLGKGHNRDNWDIFHQLEESLPSPYKHCKVLEGEATKGSNAPKDGIVGKGSNNSPASMKMMVIH